MSDAGPVALVTGASSGIGQETARHLVGRGFRVFGTSRRERGPSPDEHGIEWVVLDVGSEESARDAVGRVRRSAGRLDVLVCNAGFGIFGSVEEVPVETAARQLDTNYLGVLRCLRAALPSLREGRGRVVLVGSLAGRAPIPFQSHYSSSKAAIEALALSLHNELQAHGVHVALVEPGDIDTPFNDAMEWGHFEGSPYAEQLAAAEAVIRESLPKAPGPEVVARAVAHAAGARRPRIRYPVGADSTLVPLGKRLFPDGLVLRLIRDHFRLGGKGGPGRGGRA